KYWELFLQLFFIEWELIPNHSNMGNTILQIRFPNHLKTKRNIEFGQIFLGRNIYGGRPKFFMYCINGSFHYFQSISILSFRFPYQYPSDTCLLKIISRFKYPSISYNFSLLITHYMKGQLIFMV